jgi:K+-sensing histidine kinase KdpD
VLKTDSRNERVLEIMLVLITLALACLLHVTDAMKLMVLNIFYLPVVLAGFYLGRYRAGVLALLSVVVATIVVVSDLSGFMTDTTPLMVAIALTLWGAVLGLTSLLVGTLCDERDAKATEAHEAHVGVVEVLARYLQSANPGLQHRALRVAQLSEQVGRKMRLSTKELDDIRVAALLVDMENIEITARVIRKAVDELEDSQGIEQRTFNGTELVQSLGAALKGAFPLLLAQTSPRAGDLNSGEVPFGARIIRVVRGFVQLTDSTWDRSNLPPESALEELRIDAEAQYHPAVLHALEEVLHSRGRADTVQHASADAVEPELVGAP